MYRITKTLSFCYGHRLLDDEGKCRYLHGHNAKAVITLESEHLDRKGMVCDFADVEKAVGSWIDEEIDHTLLLHEDDPLVPVMKKEKERLRVLSCPPTAENIAKMIYDHLQAEEFPVVEVTVWETDSCSASYSR